METKIAIYADETVIYRSSETAEEIYPVQTSVYL